MIQDGQDGQDGQWDGRVGNGAWMLDLGAGVTARMAGGNMAWVGIVEAMEVI